MECSTVDAAYAGLCAECLDWYAGNTSPVEKPATALKTVARHREAAKKRKHDVEVSDDIMYRHRRGDPTMTIDQHRAALAALAADAEFEALDWLYSETAKAWHCWHQWQIVATWKAQRKAS